MAVLGLRFCARAFSSCGKRGPLFIAVRGPLTIAASLVAEHRLQRRRLSNCGSRAQLLRGMWDLPRPGLEPVSPALAGGFLTTVPRGRPRLLVLEGASSHVRRPHKQPHREAHMRGPSCQPRERAGLGLNPQTQSGPQADAAQLTSGHNLVRDPEPEPSGHTTPEFLTARNWGV